MDNKINKALLAAIMAALIISMLFAGSAAAAESFKISASRVEGSAGSQVTINVSAENARGSEGGQFTLTFDQSLVRPILIEPGDLVLSAEGGSLHMANLEYAPGELIFMWVTANADTKDSGLVCRITFELLKEGTSEIAFKDLVIVAESGESVNSVAGQIKIGPAASGDNNVTDPGQGTESTGDQPEAGDNDVEGEIRDEDEVIGELAGINPILVVMPIIIIAVLAIVYYMIKKSGKKAKNN